MGTVKIYRVRAVLDAPKKDQDLLAFATLVDQKMTNNPNFTSPGARPQRQPPPAVRRLSNYQSDPGEDTTTRKGQGDLSQVYSILVK
jgi:hypothetical protein